MNIGSGNVKSYRNAARQIYQGDEPNEQVSGLLGLVERLGKRFSLLDEPNRELRAFEGLILPLQRPQPESLLGILSVQKTLDVVLPVCPPMPLAPNQFRPDITREAKAGIRAAQILTGLFADLVQADVRPHLLVADSETDLEPVMDRAGGDDRYLEICAESAALIAGELPSGANSGTFTQYFGERLKGSLGFHALQYAADTAIRESMKTDDQIRLAIESTSNKRISKARQILGRAEENYELTVRYAAQYMALGDFVRISDEIDAVCNYPSPNNSYYNGRDKTVVPVFESRIPR